VFTVNTLSQNGTGGTFGLANAISQANSHPGDDTIEFSVTGTINLLGALEDLSSNIQIIGPGADQLTIRRDTGGDYGIFNVASGATVRMSGLTVSNGDTNNGGGIYNAGTLTVQDCTLSGNDVVYKGGGICNTGTLTVQNSALLGNSASDYGGGIYNAGTLSVQ